jgi:hypothetical protein
MEHTLASPKLLANQASPVNSQGRQVKNHNYTGHTLDNHASRPWSDNHNSKHMPNSDSPFNLDNHGHRLQGSQGSSYVRIPANLDRHNLHSEGFRRQATKSHTVRTLLGRNIVSRPWPDNQDILASADSKWLRVDNQWPGSLESTEQLVSYPCPDE